MRPHLAAVLLCVAGNAFAQGASGPQTAPPGALACSGCHGAGSDFPLNGLSPGEIESAMLAFKDGTRESTVMKRLAAGFNNAEINLIAAWLAQNGGGE